MDMNIEWRFLFGVGSTSCFKNVYSLYMEIMDMYS